MRSRGQTSVEILVIMAVALVILSALVSFASQQLRIVEEQKTVKTAEVSLQKIVEAANQVYAQGSGATRTVDITWPEGLDTTYTRISEHTIYIRTSNRTMYAEAIPVLTGALPTNAGNYSLRIRAFDGYVAIGEISLSASPSSVFAPIDRNDSSSHTITIYNVGTDVNLVFTTDWNHSDVNISLNKADANVAKGSSTTLDVNFYSTINATGSYAGKLWIQGTYSNKVETLLIPLKASVALGSASDLESYPSSIEITTYSTDANSTDFQLCNVGSTTLKNISFTPSSGDAGDWIQGIGTVSSLPSLSCTPLTITAKPTDSTSGLFEGSLFVTDYTGSQSLVIPITVQVGGMDAIFKWNWDHAVKTQNAIQDFTLLNLGSVPIEIKEIKLRNWSTCDASDSNVTGIEFNDTSIFSGISADGNWTNVTDVNLPVLTTWSNNLIQFAGIINDENEMIIADVLFGDGSIYTSPTFGSGCADIFAPSVVSDLVAYSGPNAQSVLLSFTYPGDDGNMGGVSSVIIKHSVTSALGSEAAWNNVTTTYAYEGPFPVGGTLGYVEIPDLNVGYKNYFALKFSDDNGNQAGISNSAIGRPWNSFQWSAGDFNFANMPYNAPLTSTGDVNQFILNNIQLDGGGTYTLGINIRDSNRDNGYIALMDFNTTSLTRVRVWYPTNRETIPLTAANYDQSKSISISSNINLLAGTFASVAYQYDGTLVNMDTPNTFKVIQAQGMTDFNITVDKSDPVILGT